MNKFIDDLESNEFPILGTDPERRRLVVEADSGDRVLRDTEYEYEVLEQESVADPVGQELTQVMVRPTEQQ